MSPQAIRKMIDDRFDGLSPELQRAARWVSRHGTALALHSMRDSARAAGVTPATMTRLAQRLGFDGFEGLRAPFRRGLAGPARAPLELERGRCAAVAPMLRRRGRFAECAAAGQRRLGHQSQPYGRHRRRRAALVDATQVYFLGLRVCHGVAFYLAYAYGLLRANGKLVTGIGGTLSDQVARIGGGDVLVAVSQSPYTRQTVEAVGLARTHGATVIALTDSPLSPMARHVQHVLLYDTASSAHFHSTAGAQALAEALIAAVAARGGDAATQHLRRMQGHLRSSGAYWERRGEKE